MELQNYVELSLYGDVANETRPPRHVVSAKYNTTNNCTNLIIKVRDNVNTDKIKNQIKNYYTKLGYEILSINFIKKQ